LREPIVLHTRKDKSNDEDLERQTPLDIGKRDNKREDNIYKS
jgi:hypothetical protein